MRKVVNSGAMFPSHRWYYGTSSGGPYHIGHDTAAKYNASLYRRFTVTRDTGSNDHRGLFTSRSTNVTLIDVFMRRRLKDFGLWDSRGMERFMGHSRHGETSQSTSNGWQRVTSVERGGGRVLRSLLHRCEARSRVGRDWKQEFVIGKRSDLLYNRSEHVAQASSDGETDLLTNSQCDNRASATSEAPGREPATLGLQQSVTAWSEELTQHSSRVLSENKGKPKSTWPVRDSNPGPPECESEGLPVRHLAHEVSVEQRLDARAGETRDPRGNPPTNGTVRHDSHKRKSGSDPAGNRIRFAVVGASSLTITPPRLPQPLVDPNKRLLQEANGDVYIQNKHNRISGAELRRSKVSPWGYLGHGSYVLNGLDILLQCQKLHVLIWHRYPIDHFDVLDPYTIFVLKLSAPGRLLWQLWRAVITAHLNAVHDKVTFFEINIKKKSLPLPACTVTGALSDMPSTKHAVSLTCRHTIANRKAKHCKTGIIARLPQYWDKRVARARHGLGEMSVVLPSFCRAIASASPPPGSNKYAATFEPKALDNFRRLQGICVMLTCCRFNSPKAGTLSILPQCNCTPMSKTGHGTFSSSVLVPCAFFLGPKQLSAGFLSQTCLLANRLCPDFKH
ncbi:hypothetical protein PR048_021529 [Dryococelus australis]|uniref:Uncharacterized protein n=1 Tax=Dryococelus australis TaxID=614101 RepID=A0ABQ9GYI9_9NEOP|nr:hypothetical protein PR048_021529 [Dryococelus australis]